MADLDDFFAKKDKKKGKTKKFLSSEDLAKQLEQSAKEMAAEKQKPAKIDEEAEQIKITNQEQDDEWKEFEEQKRPDLSNLKLGQLNIDEDDENNFNSIGNDYENENSNFDGDNSENPWKKGSGPEPVAKPVAAQPVPAKTGAYVPPSMQQAMRSRVNRKNAPDLQNQDNFPSLGSEKPAEPARPSKKDGFEEVKHGSKFQGASGIAGTAPVTTGNAYSSLLSESLDS